MRLVSTVLLTSVLGLAACDREPGAAVNTGDFGSATMNNTGVQNGDISAKLALGTRFAQEVPNTVNFAFNSATLDTNAQAILRQQANWIRQFPEVRFRVYGHTDLVGGNAFNQALGKRRAEAVVSFLSTQGISRSRLEALVSFGKTQPLVQTTAPEMRNRRTVTEVSGFVSRHPTVMNGKYAEVVFREYVESATRLHPEGDAVEVEITPDG